MIVGIHCDLSTKEMRDRLAERIRHHKEKIAFYTKTAKDLVDNGMAASASRSMDPVSGVQEKAREHEAQEQYLGFVRDHLVEGETYRLSEHDMRQLGFITRGGY